MSDDEVPGWSVGALLGLIVGGPAGAFIGAILGAAADEACGSTPTATGSSGTGAHPRDGTARPHAYHSVNSSIHHNADHQDPVRHMPTLPTAVDNALQALGLRPGVTLDAVKQRFHELARKYHPDMYEAAGTDPRLRVEAQERFIRIREAYEVLNQYVMDRR